MLSMWYTCTLYRAGIHNNNSYYVAVPVVYHCLQTYKAYSHTILASFSCLWMHDVKWSWEPSIYPRCNAWCVMQQHTWMIGALHCHLWFYNAHTYVPLRNLRKALHIKLLLNLCFALVGLYVTFIISTVSTSVPVLCGVVSALMHYFFLVVFFWMAAEAIHLHRKLVTVFKPDITNYLFIAMAICWGRLVHLERIMERVTQFILHELPYCHLCIHGFCFYSCSCIHCGLLVSSTLP